MFNTAITSKLLFTLLLFFSSIIFVHAQEAVPSELVIPKICKTEPYSFECTACKAHQGTNVNICNICRNNPDVKFLVVGRESIKNVKRDDKCFIEANRSFFSKSSVRVIDFYDGLLFKSNPLNTEDVIRGRVFSLGLVAIFLFIYPLFIFGLFILNPLWKKIFKNKLDFVKQLFFIITLPFTLLTLNAYVYLFLNLLKPVDKDYMIECEIKSTEEIENIYLTLVDGIELRHGLDTKVIFGDEFDCDSAIKVRDYLDD